MLNKKSQSPGFSWIYGIISLFALGVMFIVFSQVFSGNLVPVIKNMNNVSYTAGDYDASTFADVNTGIDNYMLYFKTLPFILFFCVVLFMIVASIRKEGESG